LGGPCYQAGIAKAILGRGGKVSGGRESDQERGSERQERANKRAGLAGRPVWIRELILFI